MVGGIIPLRRATSSRYDGRLGQESAPGSAIEGFRQKIPFHNKLADLGVKLGDLAIPALLALAPLVVEHPGQLLDRLTLPRRNLRRVQLVLARQFRNRLVALDRFQRYLGFELSRKSSPRPYGGSSSASANPP